MRLIYDHTLISFIVMLMAQIKGVAFYSRSLGSGFQLDVGDYLVFDKDDDVGVILRYLNERYFEPPLTSKDVSEKYSQLQLMNEFKRKLVMETVLAQLDSTKSGYPFGGVSPNLLDVAALYWTKAHGLPEDLIKRPFMEDESLDFEGMPTRYDWVSV